MNDDMADRLRAVRDMREVHDKDAVYFEFQTYRIRVPRKEMETGRVYLDPQLTEPGVAFQFFDRAEGRQWAGQQAAWLVWKTYEDDPWKNAPDADAEGRTWITRWDMHDKYFWPADHEEGEQHCARCHHVCSAFCKGMADELSVDHTVRGECSQHWIGCPGC